MAPSTVAEVYTQILKDLNDAEPLVLADFGNTNLNITRVHKNTVIAFKTRVYLHMQNWPQVVTESAKIVPAAAPFTATSGVAHTLNASYAGIFTSPNTTKESILSMPNTTAQTMQEHRTTWHIISVRVQVNHIVLCRLPVLFMQQWMQLMQGS